MNSTCDGHFNVIETEDLLNDMREVYSYIAFISKSEETARSFLRRVREKIKLLSVFPNAYPIAVIESCEGIGNAILRKMFVGNYTVFFYTDSDMNVVVIGLFSSKRNTDAIIGRFQERLS